MPTTHRGWVLSSRVIASVGGGGGGGGVHAALRQTDDFTKGIEIVVEGGNAEWELDAVQRALGNRGYVDFYGGILTPGNFVRLTAPGHFTLDDDHQQELANGWDIRVIRGTDRVPEVPAVAEVPEVPAVAAVPEVAAARATVRLRFTNTAGGYIQIERETPGAAGNAWDIHFETQTVARSLTAWKF